MWRLVKFLEEENEQSLAVGNVEGLAAVLQEIWPDGQKEDYAILAAAVASALQLGRRAQQIKDEKNNRSAEQFFRDAISAAFETGKNSAVMRP
jgi:anthranilate phosphoribosyltransferase